VLQSLWTVLTRCLMSRCSSGLYFWSDPALLDEPRSKPINSPSAPLSVAALSISRHDKQTARCPTCDILLATELATSYDNNNKWTKNFNKRPHRRLVTPRGNKWIRPNLTPHMINSSLGPTESATQTASRSVLPFCRAHKRDQQTDRQTGKPTDRPR